MAASCRFLHVLGLLSLGKHSHARESSGRTSRLRKPRPCQDACSGRGIAAGGCVDYLLQLRLVPSNEIEQDL
jgi:hypothetical protein